MRFGLKLDFFVNQFQPNLVLIEKFRYQKIRAQTLSKSPTIRGPTLTVFGISRFLVKLSKASGLQCTLQTTSQDYKPPT